MSVEASGKSGAKSPDSIRRRCPAACYHCRRRKERCDGARPCGRCVARSVGADCLSSTSTTQSDPARGLKRRFDFSETAKPVAAETVASEDNTTESISTPPSERESNSETTRILHAAVPRLSRLLEHGNGKFMFLGDSSNLSFLQNIRRLVHRSVGDCAFTTDPLRYSIVEVTPTTRPPWEEFESMPQELKPTLGEANALIQVYAIVTSGILDLFDISELINGVPQWLVGGFNTTHFATSIYYLVLAIGAQASVVAKDSNADLYFDCGRRSISFNVIDDPEILTIQFYTLVTIYMLNASRRNAAFMNFGIAVRAAHSLGLHRNETSALFPPQEKRTRDRLWKSIRVLDFFLSASLGRPPSTLQVENRRESLKPKSQDRGMESSMEDKNQSAIVGLSYIFETILREIYLKRTVSVQAVESISERHRQWASSLPSGLKIDGFEPVDDSTGSIQARTGLCHLKCSYYWSIILLTRPFLVYSVSSRATSTGDSEEKGSETSIPKTVLVYVDACVDSALRSIEVAQDLLGHPDVPKRLPFLVNSVFLSALVLGVACFAQLDHEFPLERGISAAEEILGRFQEHDAQAMRFIDIVAYLREAAHIYTKKRDTQKADKKRNVIGGMFGRIHDHSNDSQPTITPDQKYSSKSGSEHSPMSTLVSQLNGDLQHDKTPMEMSSTPSVTTLTTAGWPAEYSAPFFEAADERDGPWPSIAASLSPSSINCTWLEEEIPLFPIMSDFETWARNF